MKKHCEYPGCNNKSEGVFKVPDRREITRVVNPHYCEMNYCLIHGNGFEVVK